MRILLPIDGRSLRHRRQSKYRLACSVLIIPTGSRGGTSCSTTVNRMIPLHPAKPTGTLTTPIGCVTPPMPLADSGFSWLHSTRRPCSASNLHHLSLSWAPLFHRTSPGSRATNVQEAHKKKGLRSVGPAAVMNPFEFSSGLTACRSYLSSLRCPRFPWGHSRAQAQVQLLNARALHARSLISATCTLSGAGTSAQH